MTNLEWHIALLAALALVVRLHSVEVCGDAERRVRSLAQQALRQLRRHQQNVVLLGLKTVVFPMNSNHLHVRSNGVDVW